MKFSLHLFLFALTVLFSYQALAEKFIGLAEYEEIGSPVYLASLSTEHFPTSIRPPQKLPGKIQMRFHIQKAGYPINSFIRHLDTWGELGNKSKPYLKSEAILSDLKDSLRSVLGRPFIKKGDILLIDMLNNNILISINGKILLEEKDAGLKQYLLNIWVSEPPANTAFTRRLMKTPRSSAPYKELLAKLTQANPNFDGHSFNSVEQTPEQKTEQEPQAIVATHTSTDSKNTNKAPTKNTSTKTATKTITTAKTVTPTPKNKEIDVAKVEPNEAAIQSSVTPAKPKLETEQEPKKETKQTKQETTQERVSQADIKAEPVEKVTKEETPSDKQPKRIVSNVYVEKSNDQKPLEIVNPEQFKISIKQNLKQALDNSPIAIDASALPPAVLFVNDKGQVFSGEFAISAKQENGELYKIEKKDRLVLKRSAIQISPVAITQKMKDKPGLYAVEVNLN